MLLIHSEQMTPLTLQLQVLIRLNMGEDVNQKHYPRWERPPGIHYYDITYMHIIHTYIYNYIFISHYHIVIVAQRSFQSFFAIFNFSVALSVSAKPFCRFIRFGTDCFRDWKVSKGHVKMVTFLYPLRTSLVSLRNALILIFQTLSFIVHYCAFL